MPRLPWLFLCLAATASAQELPSAPAPAPVPEALRAPDPKAQGDLLVRLMSAARLPGAAQEARKAGVAEEQIVALIGAAEGRADAAILLTRLLEGVTAEQKASGPHPDVVAALAPYLKVPKGEVVEVPPLDAVIATLAAARPQVK